nr:PREDICTED: EF-hand and coiled-coil domain-containing protein 1-like [Equus przewalskii]
MEPSGPGSEASMEGAAGDPYQRPARRTQWLLSALAHHYGLDRGVENEIVVLATGLDQYLQEVFHHLDCRGAGRLPRADFRALCAVLGLRAEGAAAAGEATRDAAVGDTSSGNVTAGGRRRPPRTPGPDGGPDGGPDSERLARLEEENSSLRELVEDLRAALQSSDARCLALQVGLWKSQAGAPEAAARELRQGGPKPRTPGQFGNMHSSSWTLPPRQRLQDVFLAGERLWPTMLPRLLRDKCRNSGVPCIELDRLAHCWPLPSGGAGGVRGPHPEDGNPITPS